MKGKVTYFYNNNMKPNSFQLLQTKATLNFAKYLSKILDILFTKNCSVFVLSQFFDSCDVTHFTPGRNNIEWSAVPARKQVLSNKTIILFNHIVFRKNIIIFYLIIIVWILLGQ